MTVYVDSLQKYEWDQINPIARRYKIRTWCHLFAIDHDALCEMALTIGLRLSWEQAPRDIAGLTIYHFDLIPSKRHLAIRAGAVEVPSMVTAIRKWKAEK